MKSGLRILLVAGVLGVTLAGLWLWLGREPLVADLDTVRRSVPRPVPKIVLIGLDGADWNVIRPLLREGRLPTLAALMNDGASGDLRSLHPMLSPALWTSVVTGVGAETHGIRDFVYKQLGTNSQPIVNSSIRKRLALWNVFSALDIRVGIVDWYATWPAEEVAGFIVSDRIKTTEARSDGVTFPAFAALAPHFPPPDPPPAATYPAMERMTAGFDELPPGLAKALHEDLYRFRLAKNLYREYEPEFFAFYLKGIDAVSHFYWQAYEPDAEVYGATGHDQPAVFEKLVPGYYELCDQLLADFLGELDEDTTILVVSDHGFQAFGRPDNLIFDIDRLFSVMGLLEFEDPSMADRRSEREVRMDATRIYAHEGTQIISAFGERDRGVYLNVAGRDPQGLIEESRWQRTRGEIRDRLASLRTDLGSPVFSDVRIHEQSPDESRQQEPDLILRLNRDIAFDYELEIDGRAYSLYDLFLWEYGNISGTHREEGIFLARGPAIRPAFHVDSASLLDIAPTILYLAGVPVPRDLEGRVIREMLHEPEGTNRPRLRVESYEGWIERAHPAGDARNGLDEEYRERLRALGYVE